MTLFTSLGPSADCRGLTQVPTYQVRIGHACEAAFSVSQRGFSLGQGLQGKVARTPHQSKGSGGTVCSGRSRAAWAPAFMQMALRPPRRPPCSHLVAIVPRKTRAIFTVLCVPLWHWRGQHACSCLPACSG